MLGFVQTVIEAMGFKHLKSFLKLSISHPVLFIHIFKVNVFHGRERHTLSTGSHAVTLPPARIPLPVRTGQSGNQTLIFYMAPSLAECCSTAVPLGWASCHIFLNFASLSVQVSAGNRWHAQIRVCKGAIYKGVGGM